MKFAGRHPRFDRERARVYFSRVNDTVARLIEETIRKWDLAGLQR